MTWWPPAVQGRREVGAELRRHQLVGVAVQEQHGHVGPLVGEQHGVRGVPGRVVGVGREEVRGGIGEVADVVGAREPDERVGCHERVLAARRHAPGCERGEGGEVGTRGVAEQHERGGLDAGRPRRGRAVGERAEHVLDGHGVGDAVAGRADDDRHRHDALPGQRGGQRLEARRDGAAPPPAGDHHDDRRLGHPVGQVREGGQPGLVLVADRAGAGCRVGRLLALVPPCRRPQRTPTGRPGPRSRRAPATSRLQYRPWVSARHRTVRRPTALSSHASPDRPKPGRHARPLPLRDRASW